jgi:hypothetical protein
MSGVIFTWIDIEADENVYTQRVNAKGNILWGENGKVVCDAELEQDYPSSFSDGKGGAIITYEFIRASYEPEYGHSLPYFCDIHAHLISSGGQPQ